MDRAMQLMQQFFRDMVAQSAYIQRITCASNASFRIVGREVKVRLEWTKLRPFEKTYSFQDVCCNTYRLAPDAWRLEGSPCQRAKRLAQEALEARL